MQAYRGFESLPLRHPYSSVLLASGTGIRCSGSFPFRTPRGEQLDKDKRRRPSDAHDAAEAVFRLQPAKAPEVSKPTAIPGARELVSFRIDQDVLAHFQEQGLGWQDRINQALRSAAGLA